MRLVQGLAPASALALYLAAFLDPDHDVVAHYVSWLSDGRFAWLAGLAVFGMAVSALLTARFLAGRLSDPLRAVAVTALACAGALAIGTLLLPSKGYDESVWRIGFHVGMAVGAYNGIVLAAGTLAYGHWRGRLLGPAMWPWLAAFTATLGALLLAAALVRLFGSEIEVRGIIQLLLVGLAAAWMVVVPGVRVSP